MQQRTEEKSLYKKPEAPAYLLARVVAWFLAHFVFQRKVLRNEIRNQKGGFIILANHECALDVVNVIGLCKRPITFVLSRSFYSTLPLQKLFDKAGVLSKQQFQTEMKDLKAMKAVVDAGGILGLYPAGLMSENGLSTPIPPGTWKLFRFLNADVFMARATGSYHVMPKWSKKLRPGRTYMDIYRLFTKEEIQTLSQEKIKRRAEEALFFDAYAEQEKYHVSYRHGDNVEGLEHVVYQCPACRKKYSIHAQGNKLYCDACGFTAISDNQGFLYGAEETPRYISAWSQNILQWREEELKEGHALSLDCVVHTVDKVHHCFHETGFGAVTLNAKELSLVGENNGEKLEIRHSVSVFPTLPFQPGKCFEIQNGPDIYRCYPKDGKYVTEFINTLKIYHQQFIRKKT